MTMYFTQDHEWVKVEGEVATIGITAHAAEQLGEAIFVELKETGENIEKGDEIGVVESVKAASEIYAPVTGEILEANQSIVESPASIGEDPEGQSWFYKIKISDTNQLDDLMNSDAYKELIS